MLAPTFTVDNEKRFRNALERAKDTVSDLRIPLGLIAKDFYKSEKAIFGLKSAGQYQDLSASYKAKKVKRWGFTYPILRASGELEKSVTDPEDPNAIYEIINQDTLILGTRKPYARYLQEGTSRMPPRPYFIIGPEAPRFATSEMQGRLSRWNNILNSFVLKKLQSGDGSFQSAVGPLG